MMNQQGGVIAAGDPFTAEAGAEILRQGGNAVDALVAAGFAATVSESLVVNIGGAGFAMVSNEAGTKAYDFFTSIPSGPSDALDFREVVLDFGDETQSFWIGRGSTATPGLVAGLCALASEQGSLPLKTLVKPAVALAEGGFPMLRNKTYILGLLEPIFRDTDALASAYVKDGRLLGEGERVYLPDLARTLERIAAEGPDLFYRGDLAIQMVKDHRAHGGLLTESDLSSYRMVCTTPIKTGYRDYEVLLAPPSSHGGVLIAFSLKLLESCDLRGVAHHSAEHLNLLGHIMRLTNMARDAWVRPMDVAAFLSDAHVGPWLSRLKSELDQPPRDSDHEASGRGSTTHISTLDRQGGMASMTLSTGESAGYIVGKTGMALNNMLGEHDLNPNGFHQGNPGDRLNSMMCPVIVMRDGKPVLATGSAGSNRIRSAILQTLSNTLDFGMDADAAINQARAHYENGLYHLEYGIDGKSADALEEKGFRVNRWTGKNLFFGGAQMVLNSDGKQSGGADMRRDGSVVVV